MAKKLSGLDVVAESITSISYKELRDMAYAVMLGVDDDSRERSFRIDSQEDWAEALFWWARNQLDN